MRFVYDGLIFSTDLELLQIDVIHEFMQRSHWASNRTRKTVEKSIENSLCFGAYDGDVQVAFARVITDYCTFAYLCDVFVKEEYRGRGISKTLLQIITAHPDLQGLRRFLLATKDAHKLYLKYGFQPLSSGEQGRLMAIRSDAV